MKNDVFRRRDRMISTCRVLMVASLAATPGVWGQSAQASDASAAAAAPTGTLVVGVPTLGTERWDVQTLTSGVEQQVMDMVSETLIMSDPETLELLPGLADSWELSEDGLTWTFKLHEGVPWQLGPDGTDYGTVTSEDVQFTWSLMLDDVCTATRCASWQEAVGGDIANFEVVSDTEFKIHTPTVQALLPHELANAQVVPVIVSQKYVEAVGYETAVTQPLGSGPFRFVSNEPGYQVTLEAVTDHWRQTSAFETIELRSVPDDASRLAQVQSGDLDLAPIVSTQQPQAEAAGLQLISIGGVGTSSLMLGGMYPGTEFNDDDAPWIQADNPEAGLKVRQAMNAAIDREAILENILFGEGALMSAPLSFLPGADLPWNDPSWTPPTFDADVARALLAEGGYPDGFSVDMPIFAQGGRPAAEDVAEAIAGMFESVGITVNRLPMDFTTFRPNLVDRSTAGMIWQFTAPAVAEPALGLQAAYLPDGTIAHLNDPAITENVPLIYAEPDFERRMELSRTMGQALIDDVAALPVVSTNTVYVASSDLGTWTPILGNGYVSRLEFATHP